MAIGALSTLSIAADGLSAQRYKMNAVAENIAKAETTRTPEGGPYRRQRVVFEGPREVGSFRNELSAARLSLKRSRSGHRQASTQSTSGLKNDRAVVEAKTVTGGPDSLRMVYDPSHPDADGEGYVTMPDVEVITEMVDLMSAQRAYEANLSSVEAVKAMVQRALDI